MTRFGVPNDDAVDRVGAWLRPAPVLLDLEPDDIAPPAAALLRPVARRIADDHRLDAATLHDALWRREQAGSTALGSGFAVPHARIGGIDRPIVAFVRPKRAVPFGAADGRPVSSCLVILVPRDGAEQDHLALLARVARLFADRRFRRSLERAADVAAVSAAFERGIARLRR